MDIRKILNGKIFYKRQPIFFDDYLKDIIENIEKIISNEDENIKPKLILTLEKEKIEFIILLIIGIVKFYNDLSDNSKNILDEIEIGYIVVYKSKKYIYLGDSEVINGERKIKLKARNSKQQGVECGSIKYINRKNCNELSVYYGGSDKLSSIRKQTNTFNDYKNLFEKMLNNSFDFNNGIINEQIIVVFESKKDMENTLSNYFIEIDNIKYDFIDVFPCKYYTDEDNYINLKNDITKGLFLFTSKLELANEILIRNKECKTLILLGANTYKNRIDTTIHRLFRRLKKKKLNNIIIYNNYDEINDIDKLLKYDINFYSWSKSILHNKCKNNENYINSYNIVQKFLKYKIEIELLEDEEINKIFATLYKNLIALIRTNEEIYDKNDFLIVAFKMFNELQNYVYPIKIYIANNEFSHTQDKYKLILNNILEKNKDYILNYSLLSSILKNLERINIILYNRNPKIRKLKKISNTNSIIICNNEIEKQLLYKEKKLDYKKIITKEELDVYSEDENFIFLSSYKKTKEFQYSYTNKNSIVNILNYVQANQYNSKVKFMNKLIDVIATHNKLLNYELMSNECDYMRSINFKLLNNENQSIEVSEYDDVIEGDLEESIENFDYQVELEKLQSLYGSSCTNNKDIVYWGNCLAMKKIELEDNSYAFITSNSKLVLLNEDNSICGNINNCETGDRVLFIDEKTDNDLNILFDQIVTSKIFKENYKIHYENMVYWKNVLKKYIDDYQLNYTDVVAELKIYKIIKTEQTVRAWVNSESVIGPWEEKFYETIGKITCDNKLINNWKTIYESNNKIRGFRREFRKTFKIMVQNSVCDYKSQNNEFELLVNQVFGNLKEYAKVLKIKEIKDICIEIPYVQSNCLIYNQQK
ncbi:hypothetical protein FDB39_04025 [Clostridium botulinum]|nr:hypothetical protein [Clostridium botulinum]